MKAFLLIFAATIAGVCGLEATNYDISRNKELGNSPANGYNHFTKILDSTTLYITKGQLASDSTEESGLESENYKLSRRLVDSPTNANAGAYGQYYPNYPNPGYPGGNYQGYPGGNYQGYPGYNPGPAGPPGAHPGCPLCDSSVYSYCSYKQQHDACCCDNPTYMPFTCRKSSCGFLYANSCQEYNLISSCCCVDLYNKNGAPVPPGPLPVVPVAA